MEIRYCKNNIDIIYVSCLFSELKDALYKLEENYSCSERITIRMTDAKKEVYIYYRGFNGTRIISTTKCNTIQGVDTLIDMGKRIFKSFECEKMYEYIMNRI